MIKILIAILVFGLIIAVHELGHFIVAKLNDIKVNKFAIGMGPVIIKFKKGETEYSLRLLPFGGFCEMEGADETSSNERAFNNKPVINRMAVIAAGAIMNLMLGFVLIFASLLISNDKITTTVVTKFDRNASSVEGGLQVGDKITKINGMTVFTDMDLAYKITTTKDYTFDLEVRRNGKKVVLDDVKIYSYYYIRNVDRSKADDFSPYYTYNENTKEFTELRDITGLERAYYYDSNVNDYVYAIFFENRDNVNTDLQKGERYIDFSVDYQEKSFGSILSYSCRKTLTVGQMIWYSLIDLISGKYGMKDISGPIGIVTAIGSSIDYEAHFRDNLLMVMNIAIFITINLGVFNLIPLPALDGGRLFFLIIEAIRRKPIDPEKEGMVHFVGLIIAILLMLVFTFNDILNIIR